VESASDSSGDSLKIPDVYHLGGDQSTEHCAEPIHCDDYRHDLTGDRDEAQDIIADEDRTQLLLLKEQSLVSSLLTKLESISIIAVQTNLLRIVEHAVERALTRVPPVPPSPSACQHVYKSFDLQREAQQSTNRAPFRKGKIYRGGYHGTWQKNYMG